MVNLFARDVFFNGGAGFFLEQMRKVVFAVGKALADIARVLDVDEFLVYIVQRPVYGLPDLCAFAAILGSGGFAGSEPVYGTEDLRKVAADKRFTVAVPAVALID